MVPGEGMLVGNFARALFLVHSECAESSYIASRPFRVNAGPVHAYAQVQQPQLPGQRNARLLLHHTINVEFRSSRPGFFCCLL